MSSLIKLEEPELIFRYSQPLDDPRDGITLFGPLEDNAPFGIHYGLIGTESGIERFYRWVDRINKPIMHDEVSSRILWVPFPGFEAAFKIPFAKTAAANAYIDANELTNTLKIGDPYQRVYRAVELYAESILDFYKTAEENISIWFIISPESLYQECRPKSLGMDVEDRIQSKKIKLRKEIAAQHRRGQQILFNEQESDYYAYEFDNDFRRQLKARLILNGVQDPIQIIRESTLAPGDFVDKNGKLKRELEPLSQVTWNLLSTTFYKAGGKPWKLSGIRKGVCYLGLVFKRMDYEADERTACCAAQMFLDTGDGVVFKGAVGPWKVRGREEYHIDYNAAKEIIERAIEAYKTYFGKGDYPEEVFIHGRTYFNEYEWAGFSTAKSKGINIIGVRITKGNLRLFRQGKYPILRGSAHIENNTIGFLWTTGMIPKLKTSPYQGVPYPLRIEICKGEADINVVINDILALTKLNYNSCKYSDGVPITLKFADKIGDILTAAPIKKDQAPLPFKFYI